MHIFMVHMARKSGSSPTVPEFKSLRYQVLKKRASQKQPFPKNLPEKM